MIRYAQQKHLQTSPHFYATGSVCIYVKQSMSVMKRLRSCSSGL
ncbi:hypothetical protein HMPREF9996_01336 [Aggregatibacter actinomycetemcomitans Y4]|nr:hypothetical protein HMPREF9996_01336 [Aggregatibacter actinomycetemcomitans Y4]